MPSIELPIGNITPLKLSSPELGPNELQAVADVFTSGYLGMGQQVSQFEQELERYIGGGVSVVCTSSGTSALQLALSAVGIGDGDEVLLPSLTFIASAQSIVNSGARVKLCDVLPNSGNIDLDDAAKRLSPSTKAIMPVHYAGFAGDLSAVYSFAKKHKLLVIEDAAHAFGSQVDGKKIGDQGDVVCFSFDPIKNITCGEGGAVVTKNAKWAENVRVARKLGIVSKGVSQFSSQDNYDVKSKGWRYHMPDFNACVGRVQLSRFESEFKTKRQCLVNEYRKKLSGSAVSLLESNDDVVAHIFPVLVDKGREHLMTMMNASNISCGVHYKPVHLFEAFSDQGCFVNCEKLFQQLLTLPLHTAMELSDVERVCNVIFKWQETWGGKNVKTIC